jgi:hypothetical protein
MDLITPRTQVAPYGWSIDDGGRLVRPDGVTVKSVLLTHHRGKRWQVRAVADSRLIWSGTDLGRFLADFYCATRRPPEAPNA